MKIDFVILWVDGSDEKWLEEKNRYSPEKVDYSSDANRYRDFDNLQYWFRGVEQFAPWVNRIFFITWGHLPKWLDPNMPKLRIVNHKDFIPEEYLPTFNSNTIELNLHRIPDLSEHFVLFNDDVFLINHVRPEDFFVNGLPCDEMVERPVPVSGKRLRIAHTHVNNMQIINEHFSKRKMIRSHFSKLINFRYGRQIFKSLLLLPFQNYVGFLAPHLAQVHLKSTFETLWKEEPEALHTTCSNKFRGLNDVNHWLMRAWNLCSSRFVPRKRGFGRSFVLSDDNRPIIHYITRQSGKTICVNDIMVISGRDIDFEKTKAELNEAFEKILPEKSAFER